jgi:hypothetical protein
VTAASHPDQAWTRVDPGVVGSVVGDGWRKHTLSTANVKDLLAGCRFEKAQRSR